MRYTISGTEKIELSLCEKNEVNSILQNVAIILRTRTGTVPMYRDFGLPMDYKDKPLEVARTRFAVEVTEAIERFEPRAKIRGVSVETDFSGNFLGKVEVEI